MTDTPHIPGAEIADARLREIVAYQPLDFAITHDELTGMATELLAAREALAARIVPEGWKAVPVVPDGHMVRAGVDERDRPGSGATVSKIYAAMLASSPAPNVPSQVNEAGTVLLNALANDPNAVHINLLRGSMARPSLSQIIHIYGAEALREALPPSPGTATTGAAEPLPTDYSIDHHAYRVAHIPEPTIASSDQSRVERLETALTFYSGKPAWRLGHDNFIEPDDALLQDCGERARQALRGDRS